MYIKRGVTGGEGAQWSERAETAQCAYVCYEKIHFPLFWKPIIGISETIEGGQKESHIWVQIKTNFFVDAFMPKFVNGEKKDDK